MFISHLDFSFNADLPVTPGSPSSRDEVALTHSCLTSSWRVKRGFQILKRGLCMQKGDSCGCLPHNECLRMSPKTELCSEGDVPGLLNTIIFYSYFEGNQNL